MSTTITAPRFASRLTSRLETGPVVLVCAAAALAGSAATELYGLAARGLGIPMSAGGVGADEAEPITVGLFAFGTITSTFWGAILAILLARYAKRPAETFTRVAVVLTALSLVMPLAAPHTEISTKLMLAAAHVLAAAVIIPIVSRRLARVRSS